MSLIQYGWFSTHSKFQLPWKVDCDALSDDDIEALACLIAWKFAFGSVVGLPRLAEALSSKTTEGFPLLIVGDVLTTGRTMREAKEQHGGEGTIGVVLFARGKCPNWVWPVFTVNEWSQSRATGLG